MKVNLYNKEWDLTLVRSHYHYGGGLAVMAMEPNGECFAVLTVNIEDFPTKDSSYAFVDTNNNPWAEQFLVENKIATPVGFSIPSGYCMYPLYKFDLSKIKEEK